MPEIKEQPGIEKLFGIESTTEVSDDIKSDLSNISAMISEQIEDPRDIEAVIQAISSEVGNIEDKALKIKKVFERVRKIRNMKIPLDSILATFGDTTDDLERRSAVTGNWQEFLRRIDKNRKGLKESKK